MQCKLDYYFNGCCNCFASQPMEQMIPPTKTKAQTIIPWQRIIAAQKPRRTHVMVLLYLTRTAHRVPRYALQLHHRSSCSSPSNTHEEVLYVSHE